MVGIQLIAAYLLSSVAFVAGILIQYLFGSYLHEIGHLSRANAHHKTKSVIAMRSRLPLPGIDGCTVIRGCDLGRNVLGMTELENDYQPYSDEEISDIARAGERCETSFVTGVYVVAALIYILAYIACPKLRSTVMFEAMAHTLVTLILILLKCRLAYMRSDSPWGDRYIAEHPAQYREYKKAHKGNYGKLMKLAEQEGGC